MRLSLFYILPISRFPRIDIYRKIAIIAGPDNGVAKRLAKERIEFASPSSAAF
jgi:hypothetical protein